MIEIFTDGSSKGNPGPGGFGVVILKKNIKDECENSNMVKTTLKYSYHEACENTTNNREELKAILHAFELAQTKFKDETCLIYSDSAYCVNICNNWIYSWAKNGWKNSKKKTVENLDLVQNLYKYLTIDFFNCQVCKCNGHDGIIENELADALAIFNNHKFNKILEDNQILDYLSK